MKGRTSLALSLVAEQALSERPKGAKISCSATASEVRAFWLYAVAVSVQESEVRAFWLYAVAVSVQESEVRAFWLYAVAVSVQES
ncbi:MAG: hypothetical protein V5A43_05780, partial [Haloarculaceae archaeon]